MKHDPARFKVLVQERCVQFPLNSKAYIFVSDNNYYSVPVYHEIQFLGQLPFIFAQRQLVMSFVLFTQLMSSCYGH